MNCKPGDLAIVTKARDARNLGMIVRVVRAADFPCDELFGGVHWVVEARPYWGMNPRRPPVAQDGQLRPIRDPGDDARDETLDWLPVPHKELETQ